MIHNAKDLSADQKTVIEGLLGRRVLESEPPQVSDECRAEALRGLSIGA